ncbi:conjugative transposon protein TraM [Capnocytophaga canis]|uniref:conjugative transposon protein TraM n=1 Tax=Capnocytophaga canis TaxID=1848903 RepID=UPI00370DB370
MENHNNTQPLAKQKMSVLLTEEEEKQYEQQSQEKALARKQQYKKWLVFTLMGLVFLGCMYLLFGGDTSSENDPKSMDELVPEAKENVLPSDKEIAYEQALLDQKQSQQEAALGVLSDYWAQDEISQTTHSQAPQRKKESSTPNAIAHSAHTYRDIHHTLGNFYQDNSVMEEKQRLEEEIEMLKAQLSEKENQDPLDTQMALMEKSYQMASKYLPQNTNGTSTLPSDGFSENTKVTNSVPTTEKASVLPVYTTENKVVSRLPRKENDSVLTQHWLTQNQRNFVGAESFKQTATPLKNSIRACVHWQQSIRENTRVPLRLLEPIRVAQILIPQGELLTATAKVNGDRLLLEIHSLEYKGKVIPIALTAYDLDGQQGLYLPYTPDANAFREIAASMGGNSGTSFTFNSSAKDQIISDMTKSVVQGTSSYLSKKITRPAIKVKAGYQVLLVAKK